MKYEFNTFNLLAGSGSLSLGQLGGGASASPDFVFDVTTDNSGSSNDDQFKLPLLSAGTYNFNVDWGDGNDDDITAFDDAAATHTFTGGAGTYTVTISGEIEVWSFKVGGDRRKLVEISNWGSLNLGSEDKQFQDCIDLVITATDSPTVGSTLAFCFDTCSKITQIGATWDVSSCTNLNEMFDNCVLFNDPNVSDWDTSGVSNASGFVSMFRGCSVFNQSLSGWVFTGGATNTFAMFQNCVAFNQPVGSGDLGGITKMNSMFSGCTVFNQDLSDWDTSSITDIRSMFKNTSAYNQPMVTDGNKWDVSSVTLMGEMFSGATAFNSSINSWDVSKNNQFNSMFFNATSFNQSVDSWSFITTSNVSFSSMFNGATSYNQSMNSWDMTGIDGFADFCKGATAFNGNVSSWDLSLCSTTSFTGMFQDTAMDQDLSGWDVHLVTSFSNVFNGCTFSTANYDATLIGWANGTTPQNNVPFHGGDSTFTNSGAAKTAHDFLDISLGWIFTDGGPA